MGNDCIRLIGASEVQPESSQVMVPPPYLQVIRGKRDGIQILEPRGNMKAIADFRQRAPSNPQKVKPVSAASSGKTLDDVGSN